MAIAWIAGPLIDTRHARFRLEVRPSRIHRWGVFALERIPARRKVIEYTGEKIGRRETKRRAARQHVYLFALNSYWCVDGAAGGSGAELINHSCTPNLYSKVVRAHVLYMSLRVIEPGEELTVDYCFARRMEKTPCRCGSPACRGTINLLR
jgi:SET domain-containing protein